MPVAAGTAAPLLVDELAVAALAVPVEAADDMSVLMLVLSFEVVAVVAVRVVEVMVTDDSVEGVAEEDKAEDNEVADDGAEVGVADDSAVVGVALVGEESADVPAAWETVEGTGVKGSPQEKVVDWAEARVMGVRVMRRVVRRMSAVSVWSFLG
jgi:hypothetical protein